MALPTLTPVSQMSKVILPPTGNASDVTSAILPFGTYVDTNYWNATQIAAYQSGSADEVAYVYKKLGGDVLDIELTANQVYAAYEEACLEYSYLINIHQGKNVLSNLLGSPTGSFDEDGQITNVSGSVTGDSHIELTYPKFSFSYPRKVTDLFSHEAGFGGTEEIYSASFNTVDLVQDYDLQSIVSSSAEFSASVGNNRIIIRRVYYKTPRAMWNFYAYYGGVNVVGNLANYGQYADDSTFEIVPVWQNKLQAAAYEDSIKTRTSDFAYEIKNNKLRLYPTPSTYTPDKMWFDFSIADQVPWEEEGNVNSGVDGINNINTLPFQNLPYDSINSIGKQWIRRFALSVCKEMLGLIRSKFSTIPIPGNDVTLNGPDLIAQGKAEQDALRDELKIVLDEMTYAALMEKDRDLMDATKDIISQVPMPIFIL